MKPIKPLVYYASAIYLGCIVYVFSTESIFLGAVLAASFLIIILLTIEKRYCIIIILFFVFGIMSNLAYYKYNYFGSLEKIKVTKINGFYGTGKINGKNLIIKGNLKDIQVGESILAHGKFEVKKDYYKGLVGEYNIEKVEHKYNNIGSFFSNIKRKTFSKLSKNLGEEKAALIMSLCYGDTEHVTEEQRYSFQRLGVIHAISVSGFHMAIIYKLMENVLGMWTSSGISFLYLLFTGSQPATIRAFIMIMILKLSKKVFRNYDALSSLCFSMIIILTLKPFYALDLGFSLSYLSTLGIILYYNKISRTIYKLPKTINESLSLTISAQTFSMPYAAMSLGNISFGFIPGNLLLLPMYSFLVVLGNIALLFLGVDFVFNILCKLIYFMTIVLDGAHFLLLKVSPPVSYLTFTEAVGLLILISSFILVKKGFRNFKTMPVYVLIIILMQYYSIFPKLQFINIGNEELVLIKYKANNIIIHDNDINFSKNYDIINKRFFIRKVLSAEEGLNIKLKDNCIIKVHTNGDMKNNSMTLEIRNNNKTTLITRNMQDIKDIDLEKCDIIKLPSIQPYQFVSGSKNKIEVLSYKVMYSKVLAVAQLSN